MGDLEVQGGDKKGYIPIWEKLLLTIDEAAKYSNIGKNK